MNLLLLKYSVSHTLQQCFKIKKEKKITTKKLINSIPQPDVEVKTCDPDITTEIQVQDSMEKQKSV